MRDPDGKVLLWVGSHTDIHDQKLAEEKLERIVAERTARLNETVHDLEAFSYSVAHDMRAPLRAMTGFSKIVLSEYAGQMVEQGKDYLQRIADSASRLDLLIQDVLSYSKIITADLPLESVDLQTFIPQIIDSYPNLETGQAEIRIEAPLPRVLANPAALTQVISNLLGNAVKFVAPGVRPRVVIRSEVATLASDKIETPMVRLWIEDNGIGIPKKAQDKIFMMFQRLNPVGAYEGTGIGLTIVRRAVERMGGKVGLESEPGEGSKFWVELKTV